MNDLISRKEAIDAVEKESQVDGAYGYMDTKSIVDLLNNLPSAEQKKGYWSYCQKYDDWKCSLCGQYALGRYTYCPDCGTKMEIV